MTVPSLSAEHHARREDVRNHPALAGFDYIEVDRDELTLDVYFLGKAPQELRKEHFCIEGGQRIRGLQVEDLRIFRAPDPARDDRAVLKVDARGDASTYTLRAVALDERGQPTDQSLPGFDRLYDRLDFSFVAGCPSQLDCAPQTNCPPPAWSSPAIDYLAKDYASFRQLMLDRLATLVPEWRDRHAAELGMTVVEILAYVADQLSYYQDAVGTEAYLDTARQRISVRRHARLMDYAMHEGVNARAWLTLSVDDHVTLPAAGMEASSLFFVTSWPDTPGTSGTSMPAEGQVLGLDDLPPSASYELFEPVAGWPLPLDLRPAHNEMLFYTWGNRQCCIPAGATRATLRDPGEPGGQSPPSDVSARSHALRLAPGDVVLFEEVRGPETGEPGDADPAHRHVVRLTGVEYGMDELYDELIVDVSWDARDALPFPLCISSVGRAPACELLQNVSVARGNIVLVDHGRRVDGEDLESVPPSPRRWHCVDECRAAEATSAPPRYWPKLERAPLVFAEPYDPEGPACCAPDQDPRRALPQLQLAEGRKHADGTFVSETAWSPRSDLLRTHIDERHVVVEVDDDGHGRLRFGDGMATPRPRAGADMRAWYRIGYGPDGNVGANAICRVGLRGGAFEGSAITVRNPLPARGGVAPESVSDVRRLAPHAWKEQIERAVTADDYAELAERHPRVDHAAARLRWTGSDWIVQVAIDPGGQLQADAALLAEVTQLLQPYRRMGHEVMVAQARYVALDIALHICVLPNYQQSEVRAAVLEVLSNRRLSDGSLGLFHRDRVTFGGGVHLSAVVAAAQAVIGVESVLLEKFQRLHEPPGDELDTGVLKLGPFEIARLDNNPVYPENGRLALTMGGGR